MFALQTAYRLTAGPLALLLSVAAWPAAAQTVSSPADLLEAPASSAAPAPGPAAPSEEAPEAVAGARVAAPSTPDTVTLGELRRLDEKWAAATVRNDAQTISQLMAPDYVFITSSGQVLQRSDVLRAIADGRAKAVVNKGFDYLIRVYGNVGLVMHNTSFMGSLPGQNASGEYRSTHLYVRQSGRWQLASSHTTYVAPAIEHGSTFSARR